MRCTSRVLPIDSITFGSVLIILLKHGSPASLRIHLYDCLLRTAMQVDSQNFSISVGV